MRLLLLLQKACETLMARLQPHIEANPKGEWKDWVSAAYYDQVSLSATGFYKSALHYFNNVLLCSQSKKTFLVTGVTRE